jgi:DNA segregation ATPase FtsK/SpoIIIE, S-DNA-T family
MTSNTNQCEDSLSKDYKSNRTTEEADSLFEVRLKEGAFIILIALSFFLAIALWSYSSVDNSWSNYGPQQPVENWAGKAGALMADILLSLFGYLAHSFPILVMYWGAMVFRISQQKESSKILIIIKLIGATLITFGGVGLLSLHFQNPDTMNSYYAGGAFGLMLEQSLMPWFSLIGTTVILLTFFVLGFTLFAGISWVKIADFLGFTVLWIAQKIAEKWSEFKQRKAALKQKEKRKIVIEKEVVKQQLRPPVRIEPTIQKIEKSERVEQEKQELLFDEPIEGELPPIHLLDEPEAATNQVSTESLEHLSRLVELKLADFGIEVQVIAVNPGPVITRFELDLAPGVKVSRISNLAKDLARSLSTISVRIVEVIPGKSYIGLEIPNENREIVRLREVLSSKEFDESTSPLTMVLGKDISGKPVCANLGKMPHLLVAGTTGSGKSVGVNAMIISILYKASPKEVRFIMIDPKMLELSVYDDIPHLLTPVVTDMKDAANSLRWGVAEMERRYRLMSEMGVRNLAGFNRKVAEAIKAGDPLIDPLWEPTDGLAESPPTLEELPSIVIVIDELADMMMVVGKKVEELIARIAQKARAAGIHLILATQRPSVDVLTGLIKANVPSRIAFQVSSRIDSRTILDQMGADQLLGQGDMLFLPAGKSIPERVHGAFVDDPEVHRVVNDWKKRGEPNYIESITNGGPEVDAAMMPGMNSGAEDSEQDPLYDEAVAFVMETRKASISSVQRKLKIGYNRAANLVEAMELAGLVSPMGNNGQREILVPGQE